MRLTDREKEEILSAVRRFDVRASVFLFGSRTDDAKKGGDIDLLVLSDRIGTEEKRRIRRMVCDAIGDQSIDLLVAPQSSESSDPFVKLARDTGVAIQ